MPMDAQQSLVAALAELEGATLSLDPYELLRPDTLATWRNLLPKVDAFFLSEDEEELDESAVRELAGERTRFLLWKRGARGGRLWDTRARRSVDWQARAEVLRDPTGAGDAFAGGFLAGLLRGDEPERALERGVVSASFAIADHGPTGMLQATPAAAAERRRVWYGR
jgi:sugar/nucleoside kinase (ribokinase family)